MRNQSFKVKKLNLNLEKDNKKYRPLWDMAMFENGDKFAIWNKDGVDPVYNSNQKASIHLYDRTNEERVDLFPSLSASITLEELKGTVVEEVEAAEFIRSFGYRLERNYKIMLLEAISMGIEIYDYDYNEHEILNK